MKKNAIIVAKRKTEQSVDGNRVHTQGAGKLHKCSK